MRTIKRAEGFGYPVPIACQMCGKYKATVCVQKLWKATCQVNWMKSRNNFFYCVNCNMLGAGW